MKISNLIVRFLLPIAAMVLLAFAVVHVIGAQRPVPKLDPLIEPSHSPFGNTVAAAGMVEAATENIAIGSPVPGVVVEVYAKVGHKVKPGTELFRIDDR